MSDRSEYEDPDAYCETEEEQDCDYGLSEFCADPFLRSIGNCFECELYLEACEEEEKQTKKEA